MAELRPEVRDNMRNMLRDHSARLHGIIYCYGPNGEYYEARSHREVSEITGICKSTVGYALKYGSTPQGWRFERIPTKGGE